MKAYVDEIWDEADKTHAVSSGAERSPAWRDEKVAEDLEAQFKMIAVAYATGDMDEIDRVISYLAFVRRMKKQGIYEFGHWSNKDPDGR